MMAMNTYWKKRLCMSYFCDDILFSKNEKFPISKCEKKKSGKRGKRKEVKKLKIKIKKNRSNLKNWKLKLLRKEKLKNKTQKT